MEHKNVEKEGEVSMIDFVERLCLKRRICLCKILIVLQLNSISVEVVKCVVTFVAFDTRENLQPV